MSCPGPRPYPLSDLRGRTTRMTKRKHPPRQGKVTMEIGGKAYEAPYEVEAGTITVRLVLEGRSKCTQIGGVPEDMVARMLLRELITGA